jgi:hypothetical protein
MINGNPKTSKTMSGPDNFSDKPWTKSQDQDRLLAQGVQILGFAATSSAKEAGMQKGDVIIEYDGERNLTTDALSLLTGRAKAERIRVNVTFMRGDQLDVVRLPSGSLGISAMDTTIGYRPGLERAVLRPMARRQPISWYQWFGLLAICIFTWFWLHVQFPGSEVLGSVDWCLTDYNKPLVLGFSLKHITYLIMGLYMAYVLRKLR